MADKILSRREACKFLGISITTLDLLVKEGSVPFKKIGKNKSRRARVMFSRERLLIWMTSHEKNMEDPGVLKEYTEDVLEDKEDMRSLIKNNEKLKIPLETLQLFLKKARGEGLNLTESENAFLGETFEVIINVFDEKKELENKMLERSKRRFGLLEKKKIEVKKVPYKIFAASMSRDPRLSKR